MNEKIKHVLDTLPTSSGCYIMKNSGGTVIYVGKAKNLRNRVHQYFQGTDRGLKTALLVSNIDDIEYILTTDEVNALVLENMLIKKYKPHFNILLKDDKSYAYIKLAYSQKYPRLELVRKFSKGDKAGYFGPYMIGITAKDVIAMVNDIFGLRSCSKNLDKLEKNHRACLEYHIGKCAAPCMGYINEEDYKERLKKAVDFLSGDVKFAQNEIKKKMIAASENEDFEQAMLMRDRLKMLDRLERKQVVAVPRSLSADAFAIAYNQGVACISLLVIRDGRVQGIRKFDLDVTEEPREALSSFILAYYDKNQLSAKEILTNIGLTDEQSMDKYFSDSVGFSVKVSCPQKGKKKDLVDMALSNASHSLSDYMENEERKLKKARESLSQLKAALGFNGNLYRMECYDNSHISGTNYASSMVVFIDGEAEKSQYRRFKVKTVEGNDDYAVMYEIITRRLTRLKEGDKDVSFGARPDLIILDGGKGQLAYGKKAMENLGLDIPMVALAEREELLYLTPDGDPLVLKKNSPAYFLVERIRDEAHRFAITFHRNLREKKQIESELCAIEGVGKKRVECLLKALSDMDEIKNASVEKLCSVKGISRPVALNIYNYYRRKP